MAYAVRERPFCQYIVLKVSLGSEVSSNKMSTVFVVFITHNLWVISYNLQEYTEKHYFQIPYYKIIIISHKSLTVSSTKSIFSTRNPYWKNNSILFSYLLIFL